MTHNNTLLIFEKKSYQIKLFQNKEFMAEIEGKNHAIIFTYSLTDYRFDYPTDRSYCDYPILKTPAYRNKNESYGHYFDRTYTNIIIITDCDHTGFYSAHNILRHQLGEEWWRKVRSVKVVNTIFPDLQERFELIDNSVFYRLIREAEIKYYFDYNYNLNSQVFFREILKKRSIPHKDMTISKYMILALWIIRKNGGINIIKLLELFGQYHGSGKYKTIEIGSTMSRRQIIQNLIDMGLAEFGNTNGLTKRGAAFMDELVKQTFDPDLPMRLNEFMKMGSKTAKEKINSYLNTVFTKQKNRNKGL